MLKCPILDWDSDPQKDINEQVADLLRHFNETHGDRLPEDGRALLEACAHALDGAKV